jgi:hypothetical protein
MVLRDIYVHQMECGEQQKMGRLMDGGEFRDVRREGGRGSGNSPNRTDKAAVAQGLDLIDDGLLK